MAFVTVQYTGHFAACQKNWKVNDTIQSVSVNLSDMPSKENNAHSTTAEEGNTAKTRKQYQHLKCLTQVYYFKFAVNYTSIESLRNFSFAWFLQSSSLRMYIWRMRPDHHQQKHPPQILLANTKSNLRKDLMTQRNI